MIPWITGLGRRPSEQNAACITSNDPKQGEHRTISRKSDPRELLRGLMFLKGRVEETERRFKISVDWNL